MAGETQAKKLRLVVLVSGSGTNLQAMIDRIADGRLHAEIAAVISDNPDAFGLERAEKHGIPAVVIDYSKYSKKHLETIPWEKLPENFDQIVQSQRLFPHLHGSKLRERLARMVLAEQELVNIIDSYKPDYICLAGFMRLLSPYFVRHYQETTAEQNQGTDRNLAGWRIINIHPALLPAFPGVNGYGDTFEYGCRFGGITVHFVDEGEDTGPIIGQAIYPIWPRDSLEEIKKRGLSLEYELYSQCLNWLAFGYVEIDQKQTERTVFRITDPGYKDFMSNLVALAMKI